MSWGSQGATWPAVVGSIARNNLEEIRLAITERQLAASLSTFTGLGSTFAAGDITREHLVNIQSAVTTLIGTYVNHEDSSGNWNGVAAIPYWTEAAIIASIGDAGRLAVPAVGYGYRLWIIQQYAMLNKMRWTKTVNTGSAWTVSYKFAQETNAVLATAQSLTDAEFDGLGWSSSPKIISTAIGYDGATYDPGIEVGYGTMAISPYAGFTREVDWYAFGNPSQLFGEPITRIWDAYGSGMLESLFYRWHQTAATTSGTITSGQLGSATRPSPWPAYVSARRVHGWAAAFLTAVQKWNVSGGFSFIA